MVVFAEIDMACKACLINRQRRKEALERKRVNALKRQQERLARAQEAASKAKQNGVRIIYTDAGGQ